MAGLLGVLTQRGMIGIDCRQWDGAASEGERSSSSSSSGSSSRWGGQPPRDSYIIWNGWISGKTSNSLWPLPPLFRETMLQIFQNFMTKISVYNVYKKSATHLLVLEMTQPPPPQSFFGSSFILANTLCIYHAWGGVQSRHWVRVPNLPIFCVLFPWLISHLSLGSTCIQPILY